MKSKVYISCAILCLLLNTSIFAQKTIKLSDMDLSLAHQQYGRMMKGKSVTGETAIVSGKEFHEVIGVQARSVLKINLNRNASRFLAQVGISESNINLKSSTIVTIPLTDGTKIMYDTQKSGKTFVGLEGKNGGIDDGSVIFIVKGDNKELYNSGIIRKGDALKPIDIPLNNVKLLELIVEPTDDGPSGDHAVWINPIIHYAEIIPATVEAGYMEAGAQLSPETEKKLTEKINRLPILTVTSDKTPFDWLIEREKAMAGIYATPDRKGIVIANEMVAREFRLFPNLATVDITNRMTGESLLRAVSSEGSIEIDGKKRLLGGLDGQPEFGYLQRKWLNDMRTIPHSFLISDFEITPIKQTIL